MRRGLLAVAGVAVWLLTVAVTTVATYYVYLAVVNGYLMTRPSVYALRLVEGVAILLLGLLWMVAVIVEFRWLVEEFKISLFAQELGTKKPVSARRLDDFLRNHRGKPG